MIWFKKGDFVFSKSTSITSRVIQRFLGFKYSHVMIALDDFCFFEADLGGVIKSSPFKYANSTLEVVSPKVDSDFLDAYLQELEKYIGCGYDYLQLIGIFIGKLVKRPRYLPSLLNNPNMFFCGEVLAQGWIDCGGTLPLPVSQMTPKDWYNFLKGLPV